MDQNTIKDTAPELGVWWVFGLLLSIGVVILVVVFVTCVILLAVRITRKIEQREVRRASTDRDIELQDLEPSPIRTSPTHSEIDQAPVSSGRKHLHRGRGRPHREPQVVKLTSHPVAPTQTERTLDYVKVSSRWGEGEEMNVVMDATPQPLRIIKRSSQTVSDFSFCPAAATVHHLPSTTSSATISRLDSGRRPPEERPWWPPKVAKRGMPATSDPPAPKCNALHVPKQRRTRAKTSTKWLSSVLGSSSRSTSSHLSTSTSKSHDPSRDSMERTPGSDSNGQYLAAPLSHRAFTTGAIQSGRLPGPGRNRTWMPADQTESVNGIRSRAVTTSVIRNDSPDVNSQQFPTLKASWTQPSLRQRLLSRVMSGVSAKSHTSHAAMEREAVIRKLHGDALGEAGAFKDAPLGKARPSTASSIETISTLGADLELALAAFPTPPKSTVTSPTTVSSFETSRTVPRPVRRVVQPSNVAISGVTLNMFPEVDQLNLDTGRSVFVAIEMKGDIGPIDQAGNNRTRPKGLDVAIVIDATLFTSPAALLAHCEAARFLASLLDPSADRLAVLTTRPQKTDPLDFNIVSPLSRNTIRIIKSVADSIVSSTGKPEPAALRTAVECAIDLITDNTSQSCEGEPGDEAHGCIFVLTGNPHGIDPHLLSHPLCVVHVLSPGSLPWRGTSPVTCNGWKLDSLYSDSLQCMSRRRDNDSNSFFNRIRNIIAFSRQGRAGGYVSDLTIDIEAGPHCSIEAVMGRRDIAALRPGEVIAALVKVKVGAAPAQGYRLSPSPASKVSSSPVSSRDLLEELDMMLGTSPAPILVAKLTYRHSLLPAGTRCSTVAAAKIKRAMPREPFDEIKPTSNTSQESKRCIEVQKRLAYYLATHHSPRHAMLSLQEHFGDKGHHSPCPEYLELIIDELKFQARVLERFDIQSPTKTSPTTVSDISSRNTYEHFGHGLFATSNFKPQDWLIGVPDEDCSPPAPEETVLSERTPKRFNGHYGHQRAELLRSESIRPAVARPSARQAGVAVSRNKRHSGISHATSKESMDDARRIWGDMRKMSKGDRGSMDVGKMSGSSGDQSDSERARVLKDLTVRNKRSVGTDTLMSLQGEGLGRAKENVSPWL